MTTAAFDRLGALSVVVSDLDHPECVNLGPDGMIYAGGEEGQIYRIDPDGGTVVRFASIGTPVGGVVADGDGCVYACDARHGRVVRISQSGRPESFTDGGDGRRMITPNYMVFDGAGAMFVSDSGQWGRDNGVIWQVRPDGSAGVYSDEVRRFPNGLALDPADDYLYAVESSASRVVRVSLAAGIADVVQHVVTLPGIVPDGIAFDASGHLFIACYRPDRIYRLSPQGKLETYVDDWAGASLVTPTNITFFGPRLDCMAIASLAGRAVTALQLESGHGMALHYPVPHP